MKYIKTYIGIGMCIALFAGLVSFAHAATNEVTATTLEEATKQLDEQKAAISDKQKEIDKIEAEIAALKSKRNSTANEADLIAKQVAHLNQQLQKAQLELKQTQLNIKSVNAKQAETKETITSLQQSVEDNRQRLRSLVRSLYEKEQGSVIKVFFDTWSLGDVLAEQAAYKELQDRTIALIQDMKERENELKKQQESLQEQENSLSQLESQLALQQNEVSARQKEQQKFLNAKKEEQAQYEFKIKEAEQAREEIKKKVFTLQSAGVNVSLNNALDMARYASKLTGVRAALLLGVLKVESNVGSNIGSGKFPDDMQPQSRDAFLRITKKLGIDPYTAQISRRPASGKGWGGAMGPAQIMPATWEGIEPRLAGLLKKEVPNPYELTDAFVATAIFLADRGATDPAQEYTAVNKYVAGPNWQYNTWYGDKVLAVAKEYEAELAR